VSNVLITHLNTAGTELLLPLFKKNLNQGNFFLVQNPPTVSNGVVPLPKRPSLIGFANPALAPIPTAASGHRGSDPPQTDVIENAFLFSPPKFYQVGFTLTLSLLFGGTGETLPFETANCLTSPLFLLFPVDFPDCQRGGAVLLLLKKCEFIVDEAFAEDPHSAVKGCFPP
jgi:hypothetical protein